MKAAGYPAYRFSGLDWMKEIPAHWEIKKLKYLGEALIGLTFDPADVVDEGQGTLVLRSSNIQNGRIALDDNVYVTTKIPLELIARVKDILICSRNGSRALVGKTAKIEGPAVGSSFGAFTTVFRSELNDFLYYVFNSRLFAFQAGRFMTTTINQLTTGTLKDLEVPVPPMEEQCAIVDFLVREVATLDSLVGRQEQLIELLAERKEACISQAVTKGLDLDVGMQDSGVEWLGRIPQHWKVVQSRRYFRERREKASSTDLQLTASQKYGVIFQSDFMRAEGQKVMEVIKGADILKHVEPNDFVISMRSFQGGIEWCGLVGCISSAYVMLIPSSQVEPRFFSYLFKSGRYIQALQATSNLVRDGQALRFENFAQVPLPLLDKAEQKAIADFLDRETSKVDTLIAKAQIALSKLGEYRAALISAAVTGQIDVRTYRPQEAAALCQ